MSTAIQSIALDEGFGPAAAAEGRDGGSWKRTIWSDEGRSNTCLLYTSDAADDLLCVDLGGRRIIKKQTNTTHIRDT